MDVPQRQLRLALDFPAGTKFACPRCGQLCAVHDTAEKEWRHLDFWQRRTDLRARVPRVSCAEHGVSQVEVLKFPRFSGQAGRRGSRKDIHHAQDPSDLGQRLPSGSRQPPDQQPAPLEGGGGRTWSLGRLAADLASSSAPPRARSAGRKVVAESPWWSRPAEIRRLQRENEYLRRQREILYQLRKGCGLYLLRQGRAARSSALCQTDTRPRVPYPTIVIRESKSF